MFPSPAHVVLFILSPAGIVGYFYFRRFEVGDPKSLKNVVIRMSRETMLIAGIGGIIVFLRLWLMSRG